MPNPNSFQTIYHEQQIPENNVLTQGVSCFTANQDFDRIVLYANNQNNQQTSFFFDHLQLIEDNFPHDYDTIAYCSPITIGDTTCGTIDNMVYDWFIRGNGNWNYISTGGPLYTIPDPTGNDTIRYRVTRRMNPLAGIFGFNCILDTAEITVYIVDPIASIENLDSTFCSTTNDTTFFNISPPGGNISVNGISIIADTLDANTGYIIPEKTGQGWIKYCYDSACGAVCDSLLITVYPSPEIDFHFSDDTLCIGETLTLNSNMSMSGGNTGAYHIYYNDTLQNTKNYTSNSIVYVPPIAGDYEVWFVYTQNNSAQVNYPCTDSLMMGFTVLPLPDAGFDLPDTLCANATPIVLAGLVNTGTFSGQGVSNNVFDPSSINQNDWLHPIVITHTVDSLGCINTATDSIVVLPFPDADFSIDNAFCVSDAAWPLTGGGSYSGTGIVNGNSFDPSAVSQDSLGMVLNIVHELINEFGCVDIDTQTTIVYDLPDASFSIQPDTFCLTDAPVPLNGTGVFSGSGVTGNSFDPTAVPINELNVPIEITYTVTDGNGCQNTHTESVLVWDLPDAGFSGLQTAYCWDAGSVTLLPNTTGGAFSVNGTTLSNNIFTPNNYNEGDTLNIIYQLTDINNCMNTDTQTTVILAVPEADITNLNAIYCSNDTLQLIGSPAGGVFGGDYVTSGGLLTLPSVNSITGIDISYTYSDPSNGCTDSIQVSALVYPNVSSQISGLDTLEICPGDTIALAPYGSPSGGSFWGDASIINDTLFSQNQAKFYTIFYSLSDSLCVDTAVFNLQINECCPDTSVLEFGPLASVYCEGDSIPFNPALSGGKFFIDVYNPATNGSASGIWWPHDYAIAGGHWFKAGYEVTLSYQHYNTVLYDCGTLIDTSYTFNVLPDSCCATPVCCLDAFNDTYLDLPAFDSIPSIPTTYNWSYTNNPWNVSSGPVRINGTIFIHPNIDLLIDSMQFEFGPKGRIVVEQRGKLTFNNCVLSSLCETMWHGIRVLGPGSETASTPNNAGVLVAEKTWIKHAVFGVANMSIKKDSIHVEETTDGMGPIFNNDLFPNHLLPNGYELDMELNTWASLFSDKPTNSGGLIEIDTSYFVDCFYGVYHNWTAKNQSDSLKITRSVFKTESNNLRYPFDNYTQTESAIHSYKARNIYVSDCRFENVKHSTWSIESAYQKYEYNVFDNCYSGLNFNSMAQNLDTINSKHNYIEHNTFNHCQVGLTSYYNVLKITGNDFNVATVDTSDFVSSIGIMLNSSFFDVTGDNRIKSSVYGIALINNKEQVPPDNWLIDLRDPEIVDSVNNMIYANKIRNVQSAVIAVNDKSTNVAVQIWCNQFSLYDKAGIHLFSPFQIIPPTGPVLIYPTTVLADQGDCEEEFSNIPGNVFGDTPGNNTFPYAIYLDDSASGFRYYVRNPLLSTSGIGDLLYTNISSNSSSIVIECEDFNTNDSGYCGNSLITTF